MERACANVTVLLIVIVGLIGLFCTPAAARLAPDDEAIPLSNYLDYARDAADWTWDHYDEAIASWRERFDPESVFGYRPPPRLLEMAVIYAFLYEKERNPAYVERVKKVLLTYGDYRAAYPQSAIDKRADYEDGVPALPDFFTAMRYIRAFDTLNRLGQLSPGEVSKVEGIIGQSMEYLLRTAEWGAMNRTMLRAESLAWALRAVPHHPRAAIWEMQRRALGDDNWGNWEIEDATIYHGVWLYSLLGYADARQSMKALFETPEVYYYARYFLNLMCPAGVVPDFGDANWQSNWLHYMVFFETAAACYGDPQMKWAAQTIARRFVNFDEPRHVGRAYFYLDCYRWGTDAVQPKRPATLSQEVMEDVQGKKIVFRDGWKENSTYLLLNYRDEGDGGLNFRDYLRDTIPVEEEKMTHGHADENSIVMLMSGGSMLLHDGGYRDYMPSGPFGAYRQDYFHNRLCVRPEKIWMGQPAGGSRYSSRDAIPGQSMLEFLHNAGSYRRVRTMKVDFIALDDFDYSRTRLIDDKRGYEWDRVITYVKDPGLFVVFDVLKAQREEYFTLANLWHTREILARGEHWYDTGYDKIGRSEFPDDERLLVLFPATQFRLEGTEKEKRHYQDEMLIYQATAHHFELGETEGFVTVLVPHKKDEAPQAWVDRVSLVDSEPAGAALAVEIRTGERTLWVGVKQDLRMDMARDWRRPRYTYEAGRIRCGALETNGDFFFLAREGNKLAYTIVNLTRAVFDDTVLFQAKPSFFGLAFDNSPDTKGIGKARYWRDVMVLGDDDH